MYKNEYLGHDDGYSESKADKEVDTYKARPPIERAKGKRAGVGCNQRRQRPSGPADMASDEADRDGQDE